MTSSKPYLLRALHQWIVDNQLTPHLMVDATIPGTVVPEQHIRDGKIVLNIAPLSIINLVMENHLVTFDARFSGVTRNIRLPIKSIEAIYALENGQGMVFEPEEDEEDGDDLPPTDTTSGSGRPALKIVK